MGKDTNESPRVTTRKGIYVSKVHQESSDIRFFQPEITSIGPIVLCWSKALMGTVPLLQTSNAELQRSFRTSFDQVEIIPKKKVEVWL